MSAPLVPIELFTMWLATGEHGISSKAIVTRLTGVNVSQWGGSDIPYDSGDFGRCEKLLREVPFARLAFGAMRDVSPAWARLVDAWDELVVMYDAKSPRMNDRMAQLRREP